MDLSEVDIRLPMLVYVTCEKRPGYDHNKKVGAMNALVRASAIMSNGPYILNLDCDHYIYNSLALREGICFMMDRDGTVFVMSNFLRGLKKLIHLIAMPITILSSLMLICELLIEFRVQYMLEHDASFFALHFMDLSHLS
ncbi:hypothetical protein REPUB_Repub04eG0173500 [Reevesia pubescens]